MNRRDFLKLSAGLAALPFIPKALASEPKRTTRSASGLSMMHVEVSGRRTGKTTRLINEANRTTGAVVVFPSRRVAAIYRSQITGITTYPGDEDFKEPAYARFFYDEPYLWDAPIKEGAYYAGTPTRSPNKYVEANNGRYVRYITNPGKVSLCSNNLSTAVIRQEFYAEF